jgi:hypothetical protein
VPDCHAVKKAISTIKAVMIKQRFRRASKEQNKRGDTMQRKLIILQIVLSGFTATTGEAACLDKQSETVLLPRISNGTLVVTACSTSEEGGTISVGVFVGKEKRVSATTAYADSAYQILVDTVIDFDDGKSQGFGVSTGEGRDGSGMHYWKISTNGFSIQDLGDAPALKNDKFMRGFFSTLSSSSGQYQSFRYFYKVQNGKLVLKRAIGFNSNEGSASISATSMSIDNGQDFSKIRQRTLTLKDATRCQNGEISCW